MATIQGVYVALFGRPADPTGLAYFNGLTNNGANLAGIANLSGQKEYTDRFAGKNNVEIVNSIYQSLFNRDAELAGLNFFVDALTKGTLSINNIAIAILDGAQGTDKTVVTNKVAAADLYTKALDTGAEVVAYSGAAAAANAAAYIKTVGATAATQAQVDTAVAAMVTAAGGGGTGGTGVTLTLLSTADTISPNAGTEASKSTAGNDTFRAPTAGDLGTSDSVDGGAGTDTLNATMAVAALTTAVKPALKSVEIVNLTYGTLASNTNGFDATDSTGIQKLTAIDVTTAGGNNTFTLTGLENSAVFALKNFNSAVASTVTAGFASTSGSNDAATISLEKVGGAALTTLDVAGIEKLTLNSTGDANTAVVKDAALKTLVVTGDKAATITNDVANVALKNVDASALTAKLTYTATANGETILGGTKGDSITLAAGNDVVVYNTTNVSKLADMDTINTFDFTNDKLDLKAFALGATTTVGATAVNVAGDIAGFFTGTNKVILNTNAGIETVYVDVNNDGNFSAGTDLTVKIAGATAVNFTAADLILS